jgi:hypothetical protein
VEERGVLGAEALHGSLPPVEVARPFIRTTAP